MARPRRTLAAADDNTNATSTESTIDPASLPPEQRAIAERIASQDDDWRSPISEDDIEDFSLSKHILDLPPELQRLRDRHEFAFRWCECTPKRIDQLTRSQQRPHRWWVLNRDFCRANARGMEPEINDIHGGIVRIGQILLFKPYRDYSIVQDAKRRLAEGTAQAKSLRGAAEQLAKPEDGIEAMTGRAAKIRGGSDVVMAAEDPSEIGVATDDRDKDE